MNKTTFHDNIKEAWVVFSGQSDLRWLRFFKPGFRHCYVVMNDGHHWMSVDPLSSYMDVCIHHVPPAFNLPLWLKDRGHQVVKASIARRRKEAPWMLFTCVEAVKRVLGIHERWVLTPWQLYRYLTCKHNQKKGDLVWEV